VNVPNRVWLTLKDQGAIEELTGAGGPLGLWHQCVPGLYDETFGLRIEGPELTGMEFVCQLQAVRFRRVSATGIPGLPLGFPAKVGVKATSPRREAPKLGRMDPLRFPFGLLANQVQAYHKRVY